MSFSNVGFSYHWEIPFLYLPYYSNSLIHDTTVLQIPKILNSNKLKTRFESNTIWSAAHTSLRGPTSYTGKSQSRNQVIPPSLEFRMRSLSCRLRKMNLLLNVMKQANEKMRKMDYRAEKNHYIRPSSSHHFNIMGKQSTLSRST